MKTMKSLSFCFILLCGAAVLRAQAPQWQWAVSARGSGSIKDKGRSIATDSQGNQYITGLFSNTANFGSHTLTASGDSIDIFVAKLDPAGNWLWAVKAGGLDSDEGSGIALDWAGNAYVTGRFRGTATFGSHTLTSNGYNDVFAAKLDPSGNWLWAVNAGGMSSDWGVGIAVDDFGHACVTGTFHYTATFGSHTLTARYSEIFVARLGPSGNWLWAVKAGGTSLDVINGISVDGMGNAYMTGYFTGTVTFGSHTLTANMYCNTFVAKLNPSGYWLWAVQSVGTSEDHGRGIGVDGAGNACVTGLFVGTVTFGSHTLTSNGTGFDGFDIFVAKLDPSGNWLWAVKAGGTSGDCGYGAALDGAGNAYVTGGFQGTATFGSHTLTSNGDKDIFAAKLDPSGNWLWAVNAGGIRYDWGIGIAVDGAGNAYVTGDFEGTATFGSHTLTASGGYWDKDIFVAKLGNVTPVEDVLAPEAVARLHDAWPNPLSRGRSAFIKADITERSKGTLSVFNQRGQNVARHELGPGTHQIPFSGDGLPAGVYLYSLQCGAYRETKKLVLLK